MNRADVPELMTLAQAVELLANVMTAPEIMTTTEAAEFLRVSVQYLELARVKGGGPVFDRISRNIIRYRRVALVHWCAQHEVASTSQQVGK
jgi:hypothetical protein